MAASDSFTDFDEQPPPCEGLINDVMRRQRCTRKAALSALCWPPPDYERPKLPYVDLAQGTYFRHNALWWRKIGQRGAPGAALAIYDDVGPVSGQAYFGRGVVVEPVPEDELPFDPR